MIRFNSCLATSRYKINNYRIYISNIHSRFMLIKPFDNIDSFKHKQTMSAPILPPQAQAQAHCNHHKQYLCIR